MIKSIYEIGAQIGISKQESDKIAKDLVQSKLAIFRSDQGVVISITAAGIEALERDTLKPNQFERHLTTFGKFLVFIVKNFTSLL